MKIAIIGSGSVGVALAQGWAKAGHEIIFGVRDPQAQKVAELVSQIGPRARADGVTQAAAIGEVVVLATPWDAAQEVLKAAGDLTGKIVVDCTNPLAPGLAGLTLGQSTSAGEQVAAWAKGARVIKAFNTTGANNLVDPRYGGESTVMIICGDDPEAKSVVMGLGKELGFEMVVAGGITNARLLEPFAMLWIHLAYKAGLGRNFAFKLVRR